MVSALPAVAQEAGHVPVEYAAADLEGRSTIIVTAQRQQGEVVAQEGSLGLFGNRGVMDTPFSQTSYTDELVKNLQAKTLTEVLESSPSVQRIGGRFFGNDYYMIRGFAVNGYDISYDGLYGLTSVRHNGITGIERIDLLKGPSALLNGVPPSGAIGGTVNLAPKRAHDKPNTDLDVSYMSGGNIGRHVDIERRLGDDNAFGVRVNLAHRDGGTPIDFGGERETVANLALDYRGERLRLYGYLNYENQRMDAAVFSGWTLAAGVPIPKAPDNRTNPTPPWSFTKTERIFGVAKAEYDIAENWTVSAGIGLQHINELQYVTYGSVILNAAGDLREPTAYRLYPGDRYYVTMGANLHGRFETGPITHDIAVAANRLRQRWNGDSIFAPTSGGITNLYNYRITWPEPSFAGVSIPSPRGSTQLTLQGIAVSDTMSVLDNRIQFTAGVRRQNIKNENRVSGVVAYDSSATTPAFALLFKVSPYISLYGNYIEALTQAPSPPANAINFNDVLPPAKSKQEEVGIKFDLSGFGGSVALFDITQPSGVLGSDNIYRLSGQQRNRGIEFETFGEIVKGLRILGGIAYIDAVRERTQGGTLDGEKAINVPEWTISAGADWDTPLPGFSLSGRWIYNSSKFYDVTNTLQVPGWSRFDIGGRYTIKIDDHLLTLRAQVTNVTDKHYWESVNGSLILGSPRYLSLSGGFSF